MTETPERVEVEIKAITTRLPYIQVHEPDGTKLRVRVDHIRSYQEFVLEKGPRPIQQRRPYADRAQALTSGLQNSGVCLAASSSIGPYSTLQRRS